MPNPDTLAEAETIRALEEENARLRVLLLRSAAALAEAVVLLREIEEATA